MSAFSYLFSFIVLDRDRLSWSKCVTLLALLLKLSDKRLTALLNWRERIEMNRKDVLSTCPLRCKQGFFWSHRKMITDWYRCNIDVMQIADELNIGEQCRITHMI